MQKRSLSSLHISSTDLVGDMQNGELREAAQGNALLDDGEGRADHGLAGYTGCRCCKHKHKLQAHAYVLKPLMQQDLG